MNKEEFTKQIIDEAGLTIDYKAALQVWWFTRSPLSTHYRLTYEGYKVLDKITESFKFPMNSHPNGRMLVNLGKLNCAYFVQASSSEKFIHVFSTKIATIIQLYGSIEKYLNTLE